MGVTGGLTHPPPPNTGAILVLGRDLVMVPKLIHPLPPTPSSPKAGDTAAADTWMASINEERPPTPPRGRATADTPSLAFFE